MNIYWEENERSGERPKYWAEELEGGTFETNIISAIPPNVGGYAITGGRKVENSITFNFVKKPNWFHRACCRFFLGWKWIDYKDLKK